MIRVNDFDVRRASRGDRRALVNLLRQAFADEPAQAWLFPTRGVRAAATRLWFRAMLDAAFHHGWIWCLADLTAAAVWFGPGVDAELRGPAEWTLRALSAPSGAVTRRRDVLDRWLRAQRPECPHYHLAAVGTAPRARGRGRGLAALGPGLARCDREARIAYLETSEPRSVPFYERLGFAVRASTRLPAGPEVWCMTRQPRRLP